MTPEELRSYRVSLEDCNRILHSALLPEARAVCRCPRGLVSACFVLELTDGSRVVLKVQIRKSDTLLLFREREACALLRTAGVPVPEVLRVDVSRGLLPYCYSLLTWLPGEDVVEALPGLQPAGWRPIVRSLGRILARVHTVTKPATNASVLPWGRSVDQWVAERDFEFHELVQQHRRQCFIPGDVLNEVDAAWRKWHQWLGRGHFCLLHGDGNFANTKVSLPEPEISGLFDFDQTDIGEAERDFAPMETWRLKGWEEHLRAEFYAGYQEERPLASGHCERAKAYALLRDLRIILDFRAPLSQPRGLGSSVEAIQRLVGGV